MKLALLAAWLALPLVVGGAEAQQASFGCFRAGDVKAGPNCDLTELLAASRAWAGLGDVHMATVDLFVARFSGEINRDELRDRLRPSVHAEQRWRAAVEACQ